MRSRVTVAALGSLLLTGSFAAPALAHPTSSSGTPARTSARAAVCDSVTTTPTFRGAVPSPSQFLGYELGRRKATAAQIAAYLKVVDRASSEVVTGRFGTSSTGTPMTYALVGRGKNITPQRLKQVRDDIARLQNPATTPAAAKQIAARTPVVIWLMGNVHGNEPASSDAQMRVLHELADRTDCVSTSILDNAIIGVIPTQNPDGRNRNTRTSAAGFDLNRDWFARTQPETKAKVNLLRSLPGQVVIDEHGMGGNEYFFPPNADPIHHEVARGPLGWIDDVFGKANASAFAAKGLAFKTWQAGYDLFYPGYGDTMPIMNMGAAGMTFEVGQAAPFDQQVTKHYTSAMASLLAGAKARGRILTEYAQQWREATAQGSRCTLQPNHTDNPGNSVKYEVPNRGVCGYFLRPEKGKDRELARLVSTLQEDGVVVQRLTTPLFVKDFAAYGKAPAPTTLPAGTLWVSMAQRQKHWIQAQLGENSYVPFPYFYDVSGWSAPLRLNLAGGSTATKPVGAKLAPVTTPRVPAQRGPASPPAIGVLTHSDSPLAPNQSTGWLNWRLTKDWRLPSTTFVPSQITEANLKDLDVLLVPDVDAKAVAAQLGAGGTAALKAWVAGGGHLVAWRGGARYAAAAGLTTNLLSDPKVDVPGVLLRAGVERRGPLPTTAGDRVWTMYNSDPIMKPAQASNTLVGYPAATSPEWFVSGYAPGVEEVAGSAAATSEKLGTGSVTLFAFEPNFRGFTDGTARLLHDAITASRGTIDAPRSGARSAAALQVQRSAAARAARTLKPAKPFVETDARTGFRG